MGGLDIKVTCIKPSSDIKSGDMLQRLVLRVRRRIHPIPVEMPDVDGGLERVVEKRRTVPYAVCFPDKHVVHLNREPYVKRRVPYILIHPGAYRKRVRLPVAVFDDIHAGVSDRREIELHVVVAEILSPRLYRARALRDELPLRRHLKHRSGLLRGVVFIQLYDRNFVLGRMVPDL